MNEIKPVTIKVVCKAQPPIHKICEMNLRYSKLNDGSTIYSDCDGCDDYPFSDECPKCVNRVDEYLRKNKHNPHEVLNL